jgi:protein TonB
MDWAGIGLAKVFQEEGSSVLKAAVTDTLETEISFTSVLTFVLWTLTCSVAIIGVLVPYVRPHLKAKQEMVVTAEMLQVELTTEPIAHLVEDLAPAPSEVQPPTLKPIAQPIETPALTPVAEPAVVAFALPVEGPVRLVEAKVAAFAAPTEPAQTNIAQTVPTPQQLTYGQGEGRQPAPEYPYRARREGQEGTVKVRFLVGEDGRVLSAEPATPSPWPMLNESAVRVVRERWRFRAGALRNYEVAIRFQLTR